MCPPPTPKKKIEPFILQEMSTLDYKYVLQITSKIQLLQYFVVGVLVAHVL